MYLSPVASLPSPIPTKNAPQHRGIRGKTQMFFVTMVRIAVDVNKKADHLNDDRPGWDRILASPSGLEPDQLINSTASTIQETQQVGITRYSISL